MGLPLDECKQEYAYMKTPFKDKLFDKMMQYGSEFGLVNLTFPSFRRVTNYSTQMTPADLVHCATRTRTLTLTLALTLALTLTRSTASRRSSSGRTSRATRATRARCSSPRARRSGEARVPRVSTPTRAQVI